MLTMPNARFVVTGKRIGLTSRRYAETIAAAVRIAQEMEDDYPVLSIDPNPHYNG